MHNISRRAVLTGGSLLAAGLALGAGSLKPGKVSQQVESKKFGSIDAALRTAVEIRAVAGVVAAGATPKGVVYEGAFGQANVEAGTPMAPDTVFWLLSMTKPARNRTSGSTAPQHA
jgi:methyl acetate hydrolase